MVYYTKHLAHHGILGMKWGQKNGPPYPIGASDHSVSERKAGWRQSLNKQSSGSSPKKKGLSDKQKKNLKTAVKIGVVVVGASLLIYGGHKLAKTGKIDEYVKIGKKKVNVNLNNFKSGDVDFGKQKAATNTVSGLRRMSSKENTSDVIKNANPNRGNALYSNNCAYCSVASYLRSIGYEVTARDTGGKPQILGGVIENCFKGVKVIDGSAVKFGKSTKDASEMLINKFGQNASGVCDVQFKGGGGHAFNWVIENGVAKFFDGQDPTSKVNTDIDAFWRMIDTNGGLTLARLDNAEIIIDAIKEVVQ